MSRTWTGTIELEWNHETVEADVVFTLGTPSSLYDPGDPAEVVVESAWGSHTGDYDDHDLEAIATKGHAALVEAAKLAMDEDAADRQIADHEHWRM